MVDKHKYIFEEDDGFYFWDETILDLQGPFDSQILAQKAMDAYIKWINHDHQEYGIKKMKGHYE